MKYNFTFPNKIACQGYAYLIGPHATQCYKYSEVGKIARLEALKQESTSWWVNSRWVHPYFICSLWSEHYVDSAEEKLCLLLRCSRAPLSLMSLYCRNFRKNISDWNELISWSHTVEKFHFFMSFPKRQTWAIVFQAFSRSIKVLLWTFVVFCSVFTIGLVPKHFQRNALFVCLWSNLTLAYELLIHKKAANIRDKQVLCLHIWNNLSKNQF